MIIRRSVVLLAALLAFGVACASSSARRPKVEVDMTGADVSGFDSLATGYATGPIAERIAMVPFPFPRDLQGKKITAVYTVDARGEITRISVSSPSRDAKYNRELVTNLLAFRFLPAKLADGTPSRGHYRFDFQY